MAVATYTKNFSRTLVYIPIVHSQADMGSLGQSIHRSHLHRKGKTVSKRKAAAIDQIWANIESAIERLHLVYPKVRLYQDGLPVCGRELDIVQDLAESGSRNHQLLLSMIKKGAILMGTESAELLIKEYELYKSIINTSNIYPVSKMKPPQKALSESVLKARDHYIAQHINQTLCAGETGILFLGMLHASEPFFSADIQITYPIGKPVGIAGR